MTRFSMRSLVGRRLLLIYALGLLLLFASLADRMYAQTFTLTSSSTPGAWSALARFPTTRMMVFDVIPDCGRPFGGHNSRFDQHGYDDNRDPFPFPMPIAPGATPVTV